jgi:hypothetical protein
LGQNITPGSLWPLPFPKGFPLCWETLGLSAAPVTVGLEPATLEGSLTPESGKRTEALRGRSNSHSKGLLGRESNVSVSHQHYYSGKKKWRRGGVDKLPYNLPIWFSVIDGPGLWSLSPAILHFAINRSFHECRDDIWAEGLRNKNVLHPPPLCLGILSKLSTLPPSAPPPPARGAQQRLRLSRELWYALYLSSLSSDLPHQGWLASFLVLSAPSSPLPSVSSSPTICPATLMLKLVCWESANHRSKRLASTRPALKWLFSL